MWAYIISISLFSYVDGRNWCFLKKLFYKIWFLSFVRIEDKLKPTKNLSFFSIVCGFLLNPVAAHDAVTKNLNPLKALPPLVSNQTMSCQSRFFIWKIFSNFLVIFFKIFFKVMYFRKLE